MPKNASLKIIPAVAMLIALIGGVNFCWAGGSGIFLTLHAKNKTKNPDVTLKGRVGNNTDISISVNGEEMNNVSLNGRNQYRVRVPLVIGNNTIRVTARLEGKKKTIEKNIVRKAGTALEKPLWVSIVHTKNRIKKPDVTVRGKARGVSEVSIYVDGIFQGTAPVSTKKGKFKFRASLTPGVNIIEVRADNGSENVTATKRVRRLWSLS